MGILNEAVKELELLDDTSFDLTDEEALDRLDKFLNDEEEVDDRFEMIIDADAETEEDLKDSYINDLLLYCPVCHQIHFATEEEITADKENPDIVNVGEECPHCKQIDGFEIKGKIAEYQPTEQEDEEIESEVETETEEETEVDEDDVIDEQFSRFVNGDYSRKVSDYNKKGKINESVVEDTPTALNESFDIWKALDNNQKKNSLKESISIKAKEKRNALYEKFGVKNFKELKERFNGKGTKEEQENFVKVLESFGFKNVKFGKPLTESEYPFTNSKYKNIIGKQFDYTSDFDFLDIVADIIDRIDFDDYKEAEDKFDFVYEELDSSLIYTGDQWKVLQWYVSAPADLDSSSWSESLDSFTNELVKICDKIVAGNVEESLTESFNQAIQETWKGRDKIADLVERAESMYIDGHYGNMEDCVTHALDDGLIYSVDVWDLAEHYGVIDDSELIDRFYETLWNDVYNEVYSNHEDDQDNGEVDEEVDESLKEGKSIKVEPGYHEWILKIDGEPYYSFGDISEEVDYYDDAESFAEDELSAFKDELNDDLENNPRLFIKEVKTFTDEDIVNFKNQLINAYNYYKSNIDESLKEDWCKSEEELYNRIKDFETGDSIQQNGWVITKLDDKYEYFHNSMEKKYDKDPKKVANFVFNFKYRDDLLKEEDEKAIDDADADRDDKLNESQSQEISSTYNKLNKAFDVNVEDLVYGDEGFLKSRYPNGTSFAGDILYSEELWKEFEDWCKEKGIDLSYTSKINKYCDENGINFHYCKTEKDGEPTFLTVCVDEDYDFDTLNKLDGFLTSKLGIGRNWDTKDDTFELSLGYDTYKDDETVKDKLIIEESCKECNESLEELDESIFDKLVNKYCNRVYENIDSYKTTSGSIENNQIVLEGLITFKSGKTSPTKFVFESVKDEKGTRLIGLNETFSKGKKAFKLKGNVENKQFIAESLTYNYRTKVNEETKTIYGRVVNNKK